MPKFIDDAATPILQRKFSFIEGKPDIADIRPILKDSSELLEYKRSKGKIRYVSSSDNTLVDGDTLLDTGNSRNLGADFAEPFWRAEMPERPRQPTPLLHEEVSHALRSLLTPHQYIDTDAPILGGIFVP